jgi:peptide/nickel transport system permease protein
MQAYITKRLLLFIPTVLVITLMVFALLRVLPGDPALELLAGDEGDGQFTQEQLDALRARLGTDRHIVVQYADWMWGMLRLDFGTSMFTDAAISEDLVKKLPITLELTILAVLLANIVAVPLGVISALKQDTLGDYVSRIITLAGISVPNFWVAILMIIFLLLWTGWLPPLGYENLWEDPWTNLQQLFFPAIALGFSNMAFIGRVTRSAMLEVLRDDYIRTARAKGLSERLVLSRHALRNALLPVVTTSGYEFGRLLAGTVIIETIFLIPGMGRYLIDAVFHRDYTAIQGMMVVIAVSVLTVNVILDLAYAWLDPRIRFT